MKVVRVPGPGEKQLSVALKGIKDKVAKVGWFKGAKYPDGTQVAYVATIQEYGSPAQNIPPRPFMRPTIAAKQSDWRALIDLGARAILNGQLTSAEMLETLGQKARGDIQKTISQVFEPALKPATIRRRLSRYADKKTVGNLTKPLVDTGKMVATLINAVEDDKR